MISVKQLQGMEKKIKDDAATCEMPVATFKGTVALHCYVNHPAVYAEVIADCRVKSVKK